MTPTDTPTPPAETLDPQPDTGLIIILEQLYPEPGDTGGSLTPPTPPRPPVPRRRRAPGPNDRLWRNLLVLVFALFAFTVGALLGEGMNTILKRAEE
jgi:hypothetical protein